MENYLLEFEHVTGKNPKFSLMDVSFQMQPGYLYSMVGANGAGKTTLFRYILSDDTKYRGTIRICGEDIRRDHAAIMNRVGYVSEDNLFFEERTCRQNAEILGLLLDDFKLQEFDRIMERMGISCGKTYKKMSRGERLKFQLAFAMAHSPSLYLLDEVTVGMDPVFRIELFDILNEIIRDEKAGILMTSHNETEIKNRTDFVAVMEGGCLSEFRESMNLGED